MIRHKNGADRKAVPIEISLRVTIPHGRTEEDHEEAKDVARLVESLMGRKPELRFQFIQERAKFATDLDV